MEREQTILSHALVDKDAQLQLQETRTKVLLSLLGINFDPRVGTAKTLIHALNIQECAHH